MSNSDDSLSFILSELKELKNKIGRMEKRLENFEHMEKRDAPLAPSEFRDPPIYEFTFDKDFKIPKATSKDKYMEISPTAKEVLKKLVNEAYTHKRKRGVTATELAIELEKNENRRARYSSILHVLYLSDFLRKEDRGKEKEYMPTEEAMQLFNKSLDNGKEQQYEKQQRHHSP